MKVLYFAWIKARLGTGEEEVDPPAEVETVADLVQWLRGRSATHNEVLADTCAVRVAINQEFARLDDAVRAGDEVALFPPVTGG